MYGPGVTCHLVQRYTPLRHHGLHARITACDGFCLEAVVRGGEGLAVKPFKLCAGADAGGCKGAGGDVSTGGRASKLCADSGRSMLRARATGEDMLGQLWFLGCGMVVIQHYD